jgi:hypothetical protein
MKCELLQVIKNISMKNLLKSAFQAGETNEYITEIIDDMATSYVSEINFERATRRAEKLTEEQEDALIEEFKKGVKHGI